MTLTAAPMNVVFTANSDTPYCGAVLDLSNGPFVVELPPGPKPVTSKSARKFISYRDRGARLLSFHESLYRGAR